MLTPLVLAPERLALALFMGIFLGLAFEQFYKKENTRPPGGIRTFPLLAILGATLWTLDAQGHGAFSIGLIAVAAWLGIFYARRLQDQSPNALRAELVVPALNLLAYTIGGVALAQPPWVVIAVATIASLLLAGRDQLHHLADTVIADEVFTAAQFLLLAGVALPLLPNAPIAWLGAISPQRMLLAVVVISALSYFSYLVQTYLKPPGGALIAAVLGGLYSSTATTVVLARRARDSENIRSERAGIVLATGLMYIRLLVVVAVFNLADASRLAVPLIALFVFSLLVAAALYFFSSKTGASAQVEIAAGNPLQLGTAVTFALLFVLVTLATQWAQAHYGHTGINILAAIVGFTDIDPFVLSIVQGSVAGMQVGGAAVAILIAAASNDALKAVYALAFGGRRQGLAALALVIIASATLWAGWLIAHHLS